MNHAVINQKRHSFVCLLMQKNLFIIYMHTLTSILVCSESLMYPESGLRLELLCDARTLDSVMA